MTDDVTHYGPHPAGFGDTQHKGLLKDCTAPDCEPRAQAAELRTAAEKLRELASKATTDICPDWIYSAVRHVVRNCNVECSHDEHQDGTEPEWDRYDDSPYMAAMHPGVGAALADLLDDQADGDDHGVINPWALNVARQINGTQEA